MRTRPREWEENAIRALIDVTTPGSRVHIAHLADAQRCAVWSVHPLGGWGTHPHPTPFSVSIIRAAKAAGKGITVETCPHYLSLSAEDVADGDTRFKCAPPLRDAGNRKALVAALLAGEIDLVSSDHSPAPPAMKRPHDGDFLRAWGGISSLQFGLSVTWTAVREAGGSVDHLAAWWSSRPAQLVGLSQKGAIAPGAPLPRVCPCSCGFRLTRNVLQARMPTSWFGTPTRRW